MKIEMNVWAFMAMDLIAKSQELQIMFGVALIIILIRVVRWW